MKGKDFMKKDKIKKILLYILCGFAILCLMIAVLLKGYNMTLSEARYLISNKIEDFMADIKNFKPNTTNKNTNPSITCLTSGAEYRGLRNYNGKNDIAEVGWICVRCDKSNGGYMTIPNSGSTATKTFNCMHCKKSISIKLSREK